MTGSPCFDTYRLSDDHEAIRAAIRTNQIQRVVMARQLLREKGHQ